MDKGKMNRGVEAVMTELIVEILDCSNPEEYWESVNSILSTITASAAYKFGDDSRGEIVEHMVSIVLDTYESQKHFHIEGSMGQKPPLH